MTTWTTIKPPKKYPELAKNLSVDVVIIGGGIAGVLCAYRLSKQGKKVALVEKATLGSSATGATTACITEVIDSDLTEIISLFGKKSAELVWNSNREAIDEFERLITDEKIDCEFVRCPNYVYAHTHRVFDELKEECAAYKKIRHDVAIQKDRSNLPFKNFGYMEVKNQAKFHITKFLYELAQRTEKSGAYIFENTKATAIEEKDDSMIVRTRNATLTTHDVIITTYKPITNEKTHLKKGMYRTYVYEVHVPKGIFKEALYEDTANPYHYFRIDPQETFDRMIVGGEDHRDELKGMLLRKSFLGLKVFLKKLLANIDYTIVKKWSGPILEPSDGLPLIGEIKPHLYVATAFSGNGMTYSMIASMMLTDAISGIKNTWSEVYTPQRALMHPKRLAVKGKDYIEEFFGGAVKNALR